MRVLFIAGIGTSFGELYAAVHAARSLKRDGHEIQFAFICDDASLRRSVASAGLDVTACLGVLPLARGYFDPAPAIPADLGARLRAILEGQADLIYLIDYHHFFMRPEVFPNYAPAFSALQDCLATSSKPVVANDHSLWSLAPHPYPALETLIVPPPSCIRSLFLPAPPHVRNHAGLGPRHARVFFYEELLERARSKRPQAGNKDREWRILLSISHFALPLAERLSVVPVRTLLERSVSALVGLKRPVSLTVTGLPRSELDALALPPTVRLAAEGSLNTATFDTYDRSLAGFDGVILFNALSTTITRALFLCVPVLLLTHSGFPSAPPGMRPFNVYPAGIPIIEDIVAQNPFYAHVHRSELFDAEAIDKALSAIVNTRMPDIKEDHLAGCMRLSQIISRYRP